MQTLSPQPNRIIIQQLNVCKNIESPAQSYYYSATECMQKHWVPSPIVLLFSNWVYAKTLSPQPNRIIIQQLSTCINRDSKLMSKVHTEEADFN